MVIEGSFDLLEGVDAKLRRAREHLDLLKDKIADVYQNPESGRFQYWNNGEVQFLINFAPDPDVCAIAGDAVHNMRSALDHLVWDLVLLVGEQPGHHTGFPIWMHANEFRSRALYGTEDRLPQLCGLKPRSRALRLIVAAQPYHSPDPANFWLTLLNRFANHDKHHTIYSFGGIPTEPENIQEHIGWNPNARLLWSRFLEAQTIEGETEVMMFAFDPAGPHPEMYVKSRFGVAPMFSDSKKLLTYAVFDKWHEWLSAYIEEFRPLFV
jgi:hypothetical protein